jgi:hypothetical protein
MCDVCDTSPVDLGEVVPGLRLMRATISTTYPDAYWKAGEWGLVESDGNVVVVWNVGEPRVDPSCGLNEADIEALPSKTLDEVDNSIETNTEWIRHLRHVAGMCATSRLLETIIKSGWTIEQGSPEHYLAQKVALVFAAYTAATEGEV